jgi:6-phosphogluconolactonase
VAALCRAATEEITRLATQAIAARGRFIIALSGGSTPKAIFAQLAANHAEGRSTVEWSEVEVFFGDERSVPADHPDSNFRMASEALLNHVPARADRVHRVQTELGGAAAAARYEEELRQTLQPSDDAPPRFDLILLGMGTDGHTASLFPGTRALYETQAWITHNPVPQLNTERITFTYPLINRAAEILFITAGPDKAAMLRNVLRGEPTGQIYPAQRIRPISGRLRWLVDEAAASAL